MTKKQIILLGVLSLAMVVLPYIWKFGNASVSSNTADWGSFATYLNGLLMPILTVANLIILTNVNESIKGTDYREQLYRKIEQQKTKGKGAEIRVDIDKQLSVEESLSILEEKIKDVYEVLDILAENTNDNNFEISQLARLNKKNRLNMQVAMLKVNIYQELFNVSGKEEYKKALDKATKEMVKLHKITYLAD